MRLQAISYSVFGVILFTGILDAASVQAADQDVILQRLLALEENQRRLEAQLAKRDSRIKELEQRLGVGLVVTETLDSTGDAPQTIAELSASTGVSNSGRADTDEGYGRLNPGGAGFRLAETPYGVLNFSAWTYVRYLNQNGLDDNYTDSFGRTFDICLLYTSDAADDNRLV